MNEKLTCRLCAKRGKNHKNVLLENFCEIVEIIKNSFEIYMHKDTLHHICVSCYRKINDWKNYCKEILEVQKTFEVPIKLHEGTLPEVQLMSLDLDVKVQVKVESEEIKDESAISNENGQSQAEDEGTDETKNSGNSLSHRIKNRDVAINDFFDFTCPKCDQKNSSWQDYRQHIQNNHSDTHPLTITCCATVIPLERRQLSNHVTYHTNPEKLQCGICGKQFRFIDKKTKHEKHHKNMLRTGGKSNEKEDIPCGECGKVLGCRKSYNRHMRLHKSEEEREKLKVQCDICKKIFVDRSNILTHMKDFHLPKEMTVACDKCAKVFDSDKLFKAHYRRYHVEESRVTCTDCGMEMRASYLSVHRRSKHDTQTQICPLCNKEFRNRFTLNEHQRRIHSELKHECKVCGRMYTTGYKLKEHLEYHFTSNRFSCDQCDYINNVYSNMKKHRKVKHPNAPPIPEGIGRRFFEVK